MRRLVLAAALALALASVGVAAAHVLASQAAKSVTATFTATTVSALHTSTCTTSDGAYSETNATYTGTATSADSSLNGPIRLELKSLINASSNLGVVGGELVIRHGSAPNTTAQVTAVYSAGSIAGIAMGHTQDGSTRLFANLSGSFNPATGLTNGKLGSTDGGAAIKARPPAHCPPATPKASKEQKKKRH